MEEQILVIYCLCDDLLKAMHHYEDPQRKMSDAEVVGWVERSETQQFQFRRR